MKTLKAPASAIALMMAIAAPAFAQSIPPSSSPKSHHAQVLRPSTSDIPEAATGAVSHVDAFSQALAAADFDLVKDLLAPEVIILESGGIERSRDEYMDHHAQADASFLDGARVDLLSRTARIDDNLAWVATESEIHAPTDNTPLTLLSTETMILEKSSGDWKIVHIHWSSRPKKAE